MKSLLLIALLLPLTSQAQCYANNGGIYCTPSIDFRTDIDSPKIIDSQGNYRGNINSNPYDYNSIKNPYGPHGNPYMPDSVTNPYSNNYIGN